MIFIKLEENYDDYERERLDREDRRRDVGGGRKFKQSVWGPKIKILRASCLLSFVYHSLTSFLFDIDVSNVWRDIKHLDPL